MAQSTALYQKMVDEAVGATKSVFNVIKEKRGGTFTFDHCKPYVDAVNKMKPIEGQSKEVFDLHVKSVNAHYDILMGLTKTIRPEDDPFIEHYQTPPILEILYEADSGFKDAMWKFIDAIAKNKALIGLESVRRYGGMYGLTCVVDFALSVGSVSNLVNRILRQLDIPKQHKQTILACKSWGMNTSYGLGGAFRAALESGKTAAEAEQAEVDELQRAGAALAVGRPAPGGDEPMPPGVARILVSARGHGDRHRERGLEEVVHTILVHIRNGRHVDVQRDDDGVVIGRVGPTDHPAMRKAGVGRGEG